MKRVWMTMLLALATVCFGVGANAQMTPSDQSGATQAQPGAGQPAATGSDVNSRPKNGCSI